MKQKLTASLGQSVFGRLKHSKPETKEGETTGLAKTFHKLPEHATEQ